MVHRCVRSYFGVAGASGTDERKAYRERGSAAAADARNARPSPGGSRSHPLRRRAGSHAFMSQVGSRTGRFSRHRRHDLLITRFGLRAHQRPAVMSLPSGSSRLGPTCSAIRLLAADCGGPGSRPSMVVIFLPAAWATVGLRAQRPDLSRCTVHARTAANAASELRAGQLEPLADHPQDRRARIDVNRLILPVYHTVVRQTPPSRWRRARLVAGS